MVEAAPSQNPGPGGASVRPRRGHFWPAISCALLLLIFGETSWLAWQNTSATFDEPLHLTSAFDTYHYGDFRVDPEDPPLWKYWAVLGSSRGSVAVDHASPVWAAILKNFKWEGVHSIDELYRTPGNDADAIVRDGRRRMLVLGLALGAMIAWWAWKLAGPVAAVVATTAFSLDPNFLAHAALVKNDVAIGLALLALTICLWRIGQRLSAWRGLLAGILLGIAITTKFSGLLGLAIVALAMGARALMDEPWELGKFGAARTRARRLALALGLTLSLAMVAWVFLWATYLFRFAPAPDGSLFDPADAIKTCAQDLFFASKHSLLFDPAQLHAWEASWKPNLYVRAMLWLMHHRLLPQAMCIGMLFMYACGVERWSYLCGHIRVTGWWYYFPAAMLFKTPAATVIALVAAGAAWFAWRIRGGKPLLNRWSAIALVLTPALYMAAAMRSNLNIGLRHVLPVYPFLFIFLGLVAARLHRLHRRSANVVIAIFLLGLASETYARFPDYIPFFNVLVGGPRNGPWLLRDSNVDWGQALPALASWQSEHSDRQLYFAYFGQADPKYYGLRYVRIPGGFGGENQTVATKLPPVYAISGAQLLDPNLPAPWLALEKQLVRQGPIDVIGDSIYLFEAPANFSPLGNSP